MGQVEGGSNKNLTGAGMVVQLQDVVSGVLLTGVMLPHLETANCQELLFTAISGGTSTYSTKTRS